MRRVLFLDIDGVLNDRVFMANLPSERPGAIIQPGTYDPAEMIDPARVVRLNAIVEGLDVDVVLSSSWRHAYELDAMRDYLGRRGFVGRLIDKTPTLPNERHVEIKRWLAQQYPEPDRFVVLDDYPDAGVGLGHRFIRTENGLEDEHVEAARRVLS